MQQRVDFIHPFSLIKVYADKNYGLYGHLCFGKEKVLYCL